MLTVSRNDLHQTLRNWAGSTNQRFHYLRAAYNDTIETALQYRNGVEIRLAESGRVLLNGFPFDLKSGGLTAAAQAPSLAAGRKIVLRHRYPSEDTPAG